MARQKISVVIPTRQRVRQLKRVLSDLALQTYPADCMEVMVVDDGSGLDFSALQAGLPSDPSITFLHQIKQGPAAARNLALSQCRGDLVLFLNDDVQLAPDLVAIHVEQHRKSPSLVSVLGQFIFTPELRADAFCSFLEDYHFTHTHSFKSGSLLNYQAFWTSNLSVPREALNMVGGFDPAFPEPSCEDLELGYRLERDLGMAILFCDRARCWHDHLHSPIQWRMRNEMVGRNALRLFQKHEIGSDFPSLLDHGRISPAKIEVLRGRIEREMASIAGLEALVSELFRLQTQGIVVTGEVRGDASKVFQLPAERDLLLVECLQRMTRYDQVRGFLEAIRSVDIRFPIAQPLIDSDLQYQTPIAPV